MNPLGLESASALHKKGDSSFKKQHPQCIPSTIDCGLRNNPERFYAKLAGLGKSRPSCPIPQKSEEKEQENEVVEGKKK